MSQALRKLTGRIKNSNCLVVFINQIRMKIGVVLVIETTTGGNALNSAHLFVLIFVVLAVSKMVMKSLVMKLV